MWALKYWKFIAGGIAILSLVGALLYYGHTKYQEGYNKASQACEIEKQRISKAIDDRDRQIRQIKRNAEHETQSLDRTGIINELCANGWVRNPNKCPAE